MTRSLAARSRNARGPVAPRRGVDRVKLGVSAGLLLTSAATLAWYYGLFTPAPAPVAFSPEDREAFDRQQKENRRLREAGLVDEGTS